MEKFPTFSVPRDRVTGLPKREKIAGNDGYDRKLAEPLTWARVRGGNEEGNIEEKPGRRVPRGVISRGIVAPQVPTRVGIAGGDGCDRSKVDRMCGGYEVETRGWGYRGGTGQAGTVRGSQAGRNRAGSVPTFSTPLNDVDSPTRTGGEEGSQGGMAGRDGGPTKPGKCDREGGARFRMIAVYARGGECRTRCQ